jgi:hypothetical protein
LVRIRTRGSVPLPKTDSEPTLDPAIVISDLQDGN